MTLQARCLSVDCNEPITFVARVGLRFVVMTCNGHKALLDEADKAFRTLDAINTIPAYQTKVERWLETEVSMIKSIENQRQNGE